MQRNMVQVKSDRKVGQAIMGSMEFIRLDTGERTTITQDGDLVKDQVEPPILEWCDKCESWKDKLFGSMTKADGLDLIWLCLDCK